MAPYTAMSRLGVKDHNLGKEANGRAKTKIRKRTALDNGYKSVLSSAGCGAEAGVEGAYNQRCG